MIKKLTESIRNNRYNITDHADEEKEKDRLILQEIIESTVSGKIIENYPKDFPLPSCLILGYNKKGEPIHSVWAYDEVNKVAILITVYKPDPKKWINFEKRRGD